MFTHSHAVTPIVLHQNLRALRRLLCGLSGSSPRCLVAVCCVAPDLGVSRRYFFGRAQSANGPHSSFILDTRKPHIKEAKPAGGTQSDLKEILKDHTPSIQLQMIEAYRRGLQSSNEKDKKWRAFEFVSNNFGKVVLLGIVCYFLFRSSDRIIGGGFPKMLDPSVASFAENANVKFSDVQGCDEVKKELQDVVEFLRNPEKFNRLGAKLPKGVLLVGPPGVGKTLLAKAVSGEAEVPFLYVSGSSFEEVFVGMGASRVRQLFSAAKQNSPCVIFIDEIDSVGRNRTSSPHHPYANQTINQLLAEMDGFQPTEGIIVLGATNQAKDLDKALLRPGRFDVQIHVSAPTYEGRIALFRLYLNKIKTAADLDVEKLAHGTVGYTGADIQNLVNQAAIAAGLRNDVAVTMKHLWDARDRLLMGPARRKPLDDRTNEISAYHEAGHALVALLTPESTPLHKVTIIPRGESGGHTSFLPDKDLSFYTRSQLLAKLDVFMGGRVGEELAFGPEKITTGASQDFVQATLLAEKMVLQFGLSSTLGPRVIDPNELQLSPARRELIDKEVDKLLNDSMARTRAVLSSHSKQHKMLAEALLHYETLSKEEVADVLAGKMKPPKGPSPPVPSNPLPGGGQLPAASGQPTPAPEAHV